MKVSSFFILITVLIGTAALDLSAQSPQGTIEIHARRFEFTPAEIRVKKGEPVTLSLISDDVTHSLLIEGLGVNRTIVKGHATLVTFTPDKVGDFPGRCGRFCGSGHGTMHFVVHVTE
ncbi:MAG: cupredoxin domain-containing protein [Terracidiphilus sp.]|jgi:cytochrome c oxidase subunit 2